MKRVSALLLACLLLLTALPDAAAARDFSVPYAAAQTLDALGLFQGTGADEDGNPVYALERAPTRVEALVMLIRVLGQDAAVLAGGYDHPFTDVPAWAEGYVGYAYKSGLTNGVSATRFGAADTAGSDAYLTFMLRALGYSDGQDGDFTWDEPSDLAREAGLLPDGVDTANFLRADVALVSLAALSAKLKDGGGTLLDTLVSAGAVDADAAQAAGFSVSQQETGSEAAADSLDFEARVAELVNEYRAQNGLEPLTLSASLSDVARAKSLDMHDNAYFAHTGPTYGTLAQLLAYFQVSYRYAGENIARGYTSPEDVTAAWINSEGHRANILNANYTQIGVGYVADGNYWTQEFVGLG